MTSNPYLQALKKKGKALFVPFIVLGDPDKKRSIEIIRLLVGNGADALELGFPFSDPPADGPVIQAADARALSAGIRIDHCFEMLQEIRAFTDIPIGLLVYYNLILQRGVEKFYINCAESGVNSVLIADLPLEHAEEIVSIAKTHNIAPVFLVSEGTTKERLQKIVEIAEGYLYIVSYLGVTGIINAVYEESMAQVIERTRRLTKLPLFIGFGIHTPEQVRDAVTAGADGVIVGSAIIKKIPHSEAIKCLCKDLCSVLSLNVRMQ